jgi:predicted acetyltransferase
MGYAPMEDGDLDAVAELEAAAFAFPASEAGEWFARAGHENMRVWREGERAAAALMLVPMGQFFGGRSVSTMGIAGVAVALDLRQQKLGQRMMKAALIEAHERGFALSTLYPATRTLYRGVGYELAGKVVALALHSSRLELRAPHEPLEVRPITADIEPLSEALYRERAATLAGYLDRGPYIWNRVRRPRKGTVRGFAFFDGEALAAYTYFSQESLPSGHDYDAIVTDFVASSGRGYAALFHFYWSQRSVLDTVRMKAGASAPFLSLLREPRHDEEPNIDWMIRIVDLPRALAARGYPARAEIDITIEVRDDIIAANSGSWQLSLRDGRASAQRGGKPRVSLDIRALAPVFAGYYSASEAALLDAIFTGAMPGMSDMF